MAAASQAANPPADGVASANLANATLTLHDDSDSINIPPAEVELAVVIADVGDGPTASDCIESGASKRGGSNTISTTQDSAHGVHIPSNPVHLTVSSSPSSSHNDGARLKPDRPTSVVPVFWQHTRQASRISVASLTPGGITLTDNTFEEDPSADSTGSPSGSKSHLWARQVDIDDHVKIEGDVPGVGGYIVWLVKVQTLEGAGSIVLRKRFSEFEALRAQLAATFPRAGEALPGLPPKSVFYKFRSSFLEKRRVGLAYFLNCILLNPEFAGSPAVREFIFATD